MRRKSDKLFYQGVTIGLLILTGLNMFLLYRLHVHISALDMLEQEARQALTKMRARDPYWMSR